MGYAKYHEDNVEIARDRRNTVERYIPNLQTYSGYVGSIQFSEIPDEQINANKEQPEYEDMVLVCKDCGRRFVFTAKAQEYYEKMEWRAPKRCKKCRSIGNIWCLMRPSF